MDNDKGTILFLYSCRAIVVLVSDVRIVLSESLGERDNISIVIICDGICQFSIVWNVLVYRMSSVIKPPFIGIIAIPPQFCYRNRLLYDSVLSIKPVFPMQSCIVPGRCYPLTIRFKLVSFDVPRNSSVYSDFRNWVSILHIPYLTDGIHDGIEALSVCHRIIKSVISKTNRSKIVFWLIYNSICDCIKIQVKRIVPEFSKLIKICEVFPINVCTRSNMGISVVFSCYISLLSSLGINHSLCSFHVTTFNSSKIPRILRFLIHELIFSLCF